MPQGRKFDVKEIIRQNLRERSSFYKKRQNTAVLEKKKGQPILAHADQFRASFKPEDVEMPEKEHDKTEEEEMRQNKTWRKPGMM